MCSTRSVANKIREARILSGLTQRRLAKCVGVSYKSISAYERARAVPPLLTMVKIAKITNKPVGYFLDEKVNEIDFDALMGLSGESLIRLVKNLGVLKQVKRQGWVLKRVNETESVADHNFRVTAFAMILSDYCEGIDKEKVFELSLVHDWGVVGTGDVISERGRRVFDIEPKEEEERIVEELVEDIDGGERYLVLWREYARQDSREAKFLKRVEKLEMALQALEYEEDGHDPDDLDEFWENAEKYLMGSELEEYFLYLRKERENLL